MQASACRNGYSQFLIFVSATDAEPRAVASGYYGQQDIERSGRCNTECVHPLATARGSASIPFPIWIALVTD